MNENLDEIKLPLPFRTTEKAIEQKDYSVERLDYHGRIIKLIHMEHEAPWTLDNYQGGGNIPPNWREIIGKEIKNVSLVFVPYFADELERTVFNLPFGVGGEARDWYHQNIAYFFDEAAAQCGAEGIDVAVADIANKLLYRPLENADRFSFFIRSHFDKRLKNRGYFSHHQPVDEESETKIKTAVGARRLFTARGLMQEALRHKEGEEIVYIAPPTHAERVAMHIRRDLDPKTRREDNQAVRRYKITMPGLDYSVRIYKTNKSKDEHELDSLILDRWQEDWHDKVLNRLSSLAIKREAEDRTGLLTNQSEKNRHKIRLNLEEIEKAVKLLEMKKYAQARRIILSPGSWSLFPNNPIK